MTSAYSATTGRGIGRFRVSREHESAPADSCSAEQMGVETDR
jgi:hypothetical protein